MRRIFFGKNFLVVFFIAVLSFGLVGCLVPPTNTGTAKLIVSGNWTYDIKMDGTYIFFDQPAGTYYKPDIIPGTHTFEAIDTWDLIMDMIAKQYIFRLEQPQPSV